MKKVEIVLILIALITYVLHAFGVNGVDVFYTMSMMSLSFVYCYLGFAIFNNISLKNITKKAAYQSISKNQLLLAIFIGVSISLSIVTTFLISMEWPNSTTLLFPSLLPMAFFTAMSFYMQRKSESPVYKTALPRTAAFFLVTVISYMIF